MKKLFLFMTVLVLALTLVWAGYFYLSSQHNTVSKEANSPSYSQLVVLSNINNNYLGSYNLLKDQFKDTVVYYWGKVINTSFDKSKALYIITFQPQDAKGNNSGSQIMFYLPLYPPAVNQAIVGKNFQEVAQKSNNVLNISITYNDKNQFMSWNVL